jgi:CBS domain-containing protein
MRYWRVDDVMTRDVVAVQADTPWRVVTDELIAHQVSGVPVVDRFGHVLGMVSETDLLPRMEMAGKRPRTFQGRSDRRDRRKAQGRVAADVMTAPAVVVMGSLSVGVAARRMREAGVTRLAVEDDLGRLIGIVTRGDLLRAHQADERESTTDG